MNGKYESLSKYVLSYVNRLFFAANRDTDFAKRIFPAAAFDTMWDCIPTSFFSFYRFIAIKDMEIL
jgi:hypothetical protein